MEGFFSRERYLRRWSKKFPEMQGMSEEKRRRVFSYVMLRVRFWAILMALGIFAALLLIPPFYDAVLAWILGNAEYGFLQSHYSSGNFHIIVASLPMIAGALICVMLPQLLRGNHWIRKAIQKVGS